jgi:murein L,D-transpeptidase YcbB/YkuD
VAPPEVAPDPLASLDPADRPIAEKMRELLAARVDRIFANRGERTKVETFYQNRNLAPLWIEQGVQNERARAAIARIQAADADGLVASEYKIPDFGGATPEALAEAELKFTALIITFTRHLQVGRFPYQRIGHNIEVPQTPPEVADVLTRLADARDVAQAIDGFSPTYENYAKLKAKLAELRHRAGADLGRIADGPVLKVVARGPMMEDPRVPVLRERLAVEGDASDLRYDAKLAEAVKRFQRANDIPVTGSLDARTVRELNGPPKDRQIDVILINMERLRWLPRDMGKAHVVVNIPEYTLRVFKDGGLHWQTRVVVGKVDTQTPLLSGTMKYITVNPTWNVPPSIVNNEYLPALQRDPEVLARMGLKVNYNRDGSVHIYQPPGDGNALGRVRFNFPNRFLVYQHDTPDKHLFAHDRRAYSHGCMRVQDPPKYAEVLLNLVRPGEGWTADRIRRMYGSAEQDIQFPTHIPVHLTYQTATVEDGKLVVRPDIYGYDARVLAAIKSERGVVEVAAERPREPAAGGGGRRAQPAAPPPRTVGFFDQLFGGNTRAAPPRPERRIR